MIELNGIQSLRLLDIGSTEIGDAGLLNLRSQPLERLYLDGSRITDASLEHLKELRALNHVRFSNRSSNDIGSDPEVRNARPLQVTDTGVSRLKRELPRAVISK